MTKGKRAYVKVYSDDDIFRLVIADIQRKRGITLKPEDTVNCLHGLDTKGNIFMRVDLNPTYIDRNSPQQLE